MKGESGMNIFSCWSRSDRFLRVMLGAFLVGSLTGCSRADPPQMGGKSSDDAPPAAYSVMVDQAAPADALKLSKEDTRLIYQTATSVVIPVVAYCEQYDRAERMTHCVLALVSDRSEQVARVASLRPEGMGEVEYEHALRAVAYRAYLEMHPADRPGATASK